jgi:hypothetical protein
VVKHGQRLPYGENTCDPEVQLLLKHVDNLLASIVWRHSSDFVMKIPPAIKCKTKVNMKSRHNLYVSKGCNQSCQLLYLVYYALHAGPSDFNKEQTIRGK